MTIQQELKTVKVKDEVHKRLVKRAEWGQPLTEIIEELLDIADGKKK